MDVMTGNPKKERNALDRLADALVDDILKTSDEDILTEAAEDGVDTTQLAVDMRALFDRTAMEAGKVKLAAPKQAAADARRSSTGAVRIDLSDVRRRYDAMVARDHGLAEKLTLAARNGEGQSDRDIESAIEDMSELGVFDEEDDST
jgi:hypothetical protein